MEEVQGVLKDPGVEVVQEQDGVHGEVDGVHGEVEIVDDDVEVTQGQVQELEDEFERVYTTIQDLFEKVDHATNVGAGE
jgi:peptidoglycan hydrolase CwlO-like protein